MAEVIGDFEVIGKLGQGGMGAVYRARQISLDRQVALKILPAQYEQDAEFVGRFQREGRVAASLSHANLVKVYTTGFASGCHFIAMELIEGETLGQWLRRGAIPAAEALRITLDVARALEHGWQRAQLIHRDIKPGNIFLSEHGEVKLGDLGLAKSLGGETTGLTQTGSMMGTPHYISPEQARGDKDMDFRADIYSLGCTLYQMLTGRTPYEGHDPLAVMSMHLNSPPPAILKVMPQCPIPLARLVGKMLKKQKRERHASYGELISAIESVQTLFAPAVSPLETVLPADPEATIMATATATAPEDTRATGVGGPRKTGEDTHPTVRRFKLPLYGGIAAGVAVLGVAAFLLWPREEKLTKAQIYAREHAGEEQSAAVVASKNRPPDSIAAPAPGKEGWIDLVALVDPKRDGVVGEWSRGPDGLKVRKGGAHKLQIPYEPAEEYDLEIEFSFGEDDSYHSFFAILSAQGQSFAWMVGAGGKAKQIAGFSRLDGKLPGEQTEASAPLAAAFEKGRRYRSRVEVRRHSLRGLLDNEELVRWSGDFKRLSLADPTAFSDPLALGLSTSNWAITFHEIKVREVTGTGKVRDGASATTAAGESKMAASPAEPWQDVLHDPGKLELTSKVERTAEGLRFTDKGAAKHPSSQGPRRDGAVRMRTTFGSFRVHLFVRASTSGLGVEKYNLGANEKTIKIWRLGAAPLAEFPLREPLQPGQEYELELRVVGNLLTAKFNGETLGTATDETFAEGSFGAWLSDKSDTGMALIKSLEVLDLDKASSASAAPGAITPDTAPSFNVGGHRYAFVRGALSWSEAKAKAGVMGGHLATITTAEEHAKAQQFLASYLHRSNESCWIGASCEAKGEPWRWVTGESAPFDYWPTDRPNYLGTATDSYALAYLRKDVNDIRWDDVGPAEGSANALNLGFLVEWDDASADTRGAHVTEAWVRKLDRSEDNNAETGTVMQNGWIARRDANNWSSIPLGPAMRDCAVRAECKWSTAETGNGALNLRQSGTGKYFVDRTKDTIRLSYYETKTKSAKVLQEYPIAAAQLGKPFAVELRAVGSTLTVKLDGREIIHTEDDRGSRGAPGILLGSGAYRNIEVLNLDAPAAENPAPASAVTETAFVNSLGMKFVPVPIKGGPTDGQRLLFSIWETRVQDYEAFVKETKREWPKPGNFEQGATHPAVNVSWDDAQAFCAWLTEHERKAGQLGSSERYRLPSDHEWSCAAGIGEREDAAASPHSKNNKIADYSWGEQWPPPPAAGNYAGEELKTVVGAGIYRSLKGVIEGWRDPFVNTAPVGSFAPDHFGLFDISGNVWEWCDDWVDNTHAQRVLRGGSWMNYDRDSIRLSMRFRNTTAAFHYGFRVVLAREP